MKQAIRGQNISTPPSELGPRLARSGCAGDRSPRARAPARPLAELDLPDRDGQDPPSVRTLYALASEFGVTVDEVLFDQAPPPDGATRGADRLAAPGRARGPARSGAAVDRARSGVSGNG